MLFLGKDRDSLYPTNENKRRGGRNDDLMSFLKKKNCDFGCPVEG